MPVFEAFMIRSVSDWLRGRRPQELGFVLVVVHVHGSHHYNHRYKFLIPPNVMIIPMANIDVTVGHKVTMNLVFLDQNGNPMLTTVTPDAVPTWTDTTPATGTLTAGADGLSATELAIAAGTDVVNVSVTVGGVAFAASLGITSTAVPQVLTSIQINATAA